MGGCGRLGRPGRLAYDKTGNAAKLEHVLSMLLPILTFLLLAVVDFAQVHSVQQRLENGTHLAALKLLANPSVPLAAGIAAEARLPSSAVTATTSDTTDLNGDNHVTI